MAIVLALDDNALDGLGVWLVEQYRYTLGRRVWELPQGAYDQGRDLAPEDLARRELREETGLRAGRVDKLAQLSVARFGIDRFEWMLREGEIVDSLTHATYSLHLMRK